MFCSVLIYVIVNCHRQLLIWPTKKCMLSIWLGFYDNHIYAKAICIMQCVDWKTGQSYIVNVPSTPANYNPMLVARGIQMTRMGVSMQPMSRPIQQLLQSGAYCQTRLSGVCVISKCTSIQWYNIPLSIT